MSPMTGAPAGSCFGLAPRSGLDLRFLRPGPGREVEVVAGPVEPGGAGVEPVVQWLPRPGNDHHARLFEDGPGRYRLWVQDVGWYDVDVPARRVVVPQEADPLRREQRLWGVPVLLLRGEDDEVPLHAAAVEVDGRALVLVAPGRFGKTTLAAAFHRAGHRLLTEDLAMVAAGPVPGVLPGPPVLRLRPDVAARVAVPDARVLRADPDRTYLLIDPSRRGTGAVVPLAAVVFLHLDAGPPRLERASAAARLPELWATSFAFRADRAALFGRLAAVADRVPVWDLRRTPTFEELPAVVDLLVERCLRG
jgi:hypothetical protein